jgi:hypothetical protein
MKTDPWTDLAPPSTAEAINARRVDASLRWNFYWARSVDQKCLLILQHSVDPASMPRPPKMKGIDVSSSIDESNNTSMLIWSLQHSSHRDIFHRLCTDIVNFARSATSEPEAVEVSLGRTWRWHHLLRGGTDGRLSGEEQKGLIGELMFLEKLIDVGIAPANAVNAWRGPLGSPKDFEIGRICVEVKARRGAATPYVAISSEHQLDSSGTDALFLYVVELDQAPSDSRERFTLTDVADRVKRRILGVSPAAADALDSLLVAAGFRSEDNYEDMPWIRGPERLYAVGEDFPAVTPANFGTGVSNVRYSISLPDCEPFRTDDPVLVSALKEVTNGA